MEQPSHLKQPSPQKQLKWDSLFIGVNFTSLCMAQELSRKGQRVALLHTSSSPSFRKEGVDPVLLPLFFNGFYTSQAEEAQENAILSFEKFLKSPAPAPSSSPVSASIPNPFSSPNLASVSPPSPPFSYSDAEWNWSPEPKPNSLFSFTGKKLLPCSFEELKDFCSAPYGRHLSYFLDAYCWKWPTFSKNVEIQMLQNFTSLGGVFFSTEIQAWNLEQNKVVSLTVKNGEKLHAHQFVYSLPLEGDTTSLPKNIFSALSIQSVKSIKKKKPWSLLSLEFYLKEEALQEAPQIQDGMHILYYRFYTPQPKGKYPVSSLSPVLGAQLETGHLRWFCLFDSEVYGSTEDTRAILRKMRQQIYQAYPQIEKLTDLASQKIRFFPQSLPSERGFNLPFQTSVENLYHLSSYEREGSAFSPWPSLQQLPKRLLLLSQSHLS